MDLSALKKQTPAILSKRREKVSNFFTVEQLDLQFSNNKKMTYERLAGGNGAILAVPFVAVAELRKVLVELRSQPHGTLLAAAWEVERLVG